MVNCFKCRDEGIAGGCTSCGKKPEPKTDIVKVSDAIGIPMQYRNDLVWDSKKLICNHQEKKQDKAFLTYMGVLDGIYKQATNCILANKSIFIISDRGSGKHTFVYAMMKELRNCGMTTCQMIDHNEYLRISALETERYYEKQKISLDSIIYSDFCAMSIDPSNRFTAIKAISSLLMKRGHAGKPTFIISDFPLSELETKWNTSTDIRYQDGLDELRYCRIIKSY